MGRKKLPDISKEELTKLYYTYGSIYKVGDLINKSGDTVWRWLKFYEVSPKPKICNYCNVLLNEDNVYPSDWEKGSLICKNCRKENRKINTTVEKQKNYSQNYRFNLKEIILENYGNSCSCCGENIWQFLTIDHIDNWGSQHRRELSISGGTAFYRWLKNNNFPKEGFQILCMNCNTCLGFHGFCSHKIIYSDNCFDCNIILDENNMFSLYFNAKINLCRQCVINRSIKREKIAKDIISGGQTLNSRRITQKKKTLALREKIIKGYGGVCNCCGENNPLFLTIDHMNNDGSIEKNEEGYTPQKFYKSIIDNNFPDNYRLLCSNCNSCRAIYGICYHELCKNMNSDFISINEYKDIILHNNKETNVA